MALSDESAERGRGCGPVPRQYELESIQIGRPHRAPRMPEGALRVIARVLPRLRRPTFRSLGLQSHGLCHACGTITEFDVREVFWPALVTEWRLTPAMKAAFDRRESGMCPVCNNNYRNRQLARALVDVYGRNGEVSVAELTRSEHFRSLRILGIDLDFLLMLEECPGFSRSNYITSLIPARGLPDNGLPFGDGRFDLILVSDTLEHTPAYRRALREISRVLKPDGQFVTVQPVILSRRTLTRCVVDEAGLVRHLTSCRPRIAPARRMTAWCSWSSGLTSSANSRRPTWNRPCTSTMCHLTTTPGWQSAKRAPRTML